MTLHKFTDLLEKAETLGEFVLFQEEQIESLVSNMDSIQVRNFQDRVARLKQNIGRLEDVLSAKGHSTPPNYPSAS